MEWIREVKVNEAKKVFIVILMEVVMMLNHISVAEFSGEIIAEVPCEQGLISLITDGINYHLTFPSKKNGEPSHEYTIEKWGNLSPTNLTHDDKVLRLSFSDTATLLIKWSEEGNSLEIVSWQITSKDFDLIQFSMHEECVVMTLWKNREVDRSVFLIPGRTNEIISDGIIRCSLLPVSIDDALNIIDNNGYATIFIDGSETQVTIFEKPTTDSKAVFKLYKGAPIELKEESNDWAHIRVGEITGWLPSQYISLGEKMLSVENAIFSEEYTIQENAKLYRSMDDNIISDNVEADQVFAIGECEDGRIIIYFLETGSVYLIDRNELKTPYDG